MNKIKGWNFYQVIKNGDSYFQVQIIYKNISKISGQKNMKNTDKIMIIFYQVTVAFFLLLCNLNNQ